MNVLGDSSISFNASVGDPWRFGLRADGGEVFGGQSASDIAQPWDKCTARHFIKREGGHLQIDSRYGSVGGGVSPNKCKREDVSMGALAAGTLDGYRAISRVSRVDGLSAFVLRAADR